MPKFPHYQQHDQIDCGPTCLRMVAKHYGRHFTAQSLRERAEIGKDGASLLGIADQNISSTSCKYCYGLVGQRGSCRSF